MKQLTFIKRSNGDHWVGDGFPVKSIFSYRDIAKEMSPFLLMDYAGPVVFAPTTRKLGVGQHPHRGFETVTIVYEGGVSHQDSSGGGGTIGSGDVQWMTAAAGLIHEEYHSPEYAQKGGLFEMVQLWVNLPANLATKSGYSIGTLYYYLEKAEDAFILMIIKRRERQFHQLVEIINQFPENKPIGDLLAQMIDSSFKEYNRMNHRSFFLIFRMILRFSKNPLAFDDALSLLVEPLINAQRRNTTDTFRELESDDLLMLLKTCFAIVRRPFLEQNPIAGSPKHRELAIDTMARLLGK